MTDAKQRVEMDTLGTCILESSLPEEELKKLGFGATRKDSDEILAAHKIELTFHHKLSIHKPTTGVMSFWMSGKRLHGGGDSKMYICPGSHIGRNQCDTFITEASVREGVSACPGCGLAWNPEETIGEIICKLTMQGWADKLLYYFQKLGHNADLIIKRPAFELHKASEQEQDRNLGGEKLGKVRNKRVVVAYPLKNIIKDTSNGADMYGRFKAFLLA